MNASFKFLIYENLIISMKMELVKVSILLIVFIMKAVASKLDTYSQIYMTSFSKFKSENEQVQVQVIEVYEDKAMTLKTISFDNVSYTRHSGSGGLVDGIVLELSKSSNAGIAKSYFNDKSTKQSDSQILVRFSNFNKCEVAAVTRQDLNYEIVQIGLTDKSGKVTYLALSFGAADKSNKKTVASELAKLCTDYEENLKKRFDEFYKELDNYWKTKTQIQGITDKIKQINDISKAEKDKLSQVATDKTGYEKSLQENKEKLFNTQFEMDKIQKNLKDMYKQVNEIKTRKSENEKNMTDMNATLDKMNNETKTKQEVLDKLNKESDELRKRNQELIKNIKEGKNKIQGVEKTLSAEREAQSEVDKAIDQLNKQISENTQQLTKLNKEIQSNKDNIDKLALEDLPNVVKKTKSMIDENKGQSEKTMKEHKAAEENLKKSDENIKNANDQIQKLLSDDSVIELTKKSKIKKNIEKAKTIFDAMKKTFPVLPDIFMNNMFNFISLNQYESMNYVQSIRPSYFSLYDHLFGLNDPAKAKKAAYKKTKKTK